MSQDQCYDQGLSGQSSQSPSHQQVQKRMNQFSIDFFIEKRFITQEDLKQILDNVRCLYNIRAIKLNPQNQIPALDGTAFSVIDPDENKLNARCDAVNKILQLIEQRNKQTLEVIMLIPEGTVSCVIGTQGKYIEHIKLETKVHLVVNQPIYEFQLRTVTIIGESSRIFNAIKMIIKQLQERGISNEDYTKKAEPLDPRRVMTKAKFAFQSIQRGNTLQYLKGKGNNDIKIKKNKLKKDEGVLQIDGTLFNVQEAIQNIIKKVTQQFKKNEFDIRIVMPANFASKLIGAKGCQIKELANKAKGAQIKVLSDRDDTDANQDCLVQVTGSMENKQEATILILEQIECFKNGGPILENGKYINENFAQQYKNSVQVQDMKQKRLVWKNQLGRHYSSSSSSERRQRSRSSNKRQKYLRRSRSSSSNKSNRRRSKQQGLKTKIVVKQSLIELIHKQLVRYCHDFNVTIKTYPSVLYEKDKQDVGWESIIKISGDVRGCITVIQYILNEQCKLSKR
ncbi:unnamed protein product (macronuclear) [Paramecium tetraurelia]|uniref:K Homology domain-containing protein n=1 Tax=Paramecium tetraurelia TaxID=5888 RepID=A0DSW1_PARTE|nr:uncharacterized protein GSPATT00019821001 [Paramecium tetraurelia]CAK86128.1 unnamed protein product [Paramecium tetraurelia]|eukprot:XP_001453525.1 hypothetical protein (macronuclear) [Paramecium tetraurelia strain d4-2]